MISMASMFKAISRLYVRGTLIQIGNKWGRYSNHAVISQIGVLSAVIMFPLSMWLSLLLSGGYVYFVFINLVLGSPLFFYLRRIAEDEFKENTNILGLSDSQVVLFSNVIYVVIVVVSGFLMFAVIDGFD
ncbi:hypothetical protein [uncultured Rheinheimera sp.]|jgi:hypothetical protein|uniref:hypothetical protein n=1 Tax=uncultured Rheinheimera sp. TaxID=400532 RepID=UPI002597577B|nr:hypothetical protein [uncultured Rheinheimera sp.]